MRDDLKGQGYSKEDEYFHRKDQELIAKLREKAEADRARLETENKKSESWMRCPKCGSTMTEEKYGDQVRVDRCTSQSCGGVCCDGGDREVLLTADACLLQW